MNNKFNFKFYSSVKKIISCQVKLFLNPIVNGLENIPIKPYILVGNHKSLLDIPLLVTYIDDDIHFMAKKELFNFRLFKTILMNLGAFPVDRTKTDIDAIKTSLKILNEGDVLGIFPEGTRNKTDKILLPFKNGAIKLSHKTNVPIVPFGISGSYGFRSKIGLNIGKSINFNTFSVDDENKYLEEKVKELILNKF